MSVAPNPADRRVAIDYVLGLPGRTTIIIRDASGGLVTTLYEGDQEAGAHRAEWDAGGAAAGVYYCRISSGSWSITRPVVVLR